MRDDAGAELLQLPDPGAYTPEEVHPLLRAQVAHLLTHRRAWLFGKLYRLDVRERDLKAALAQPGGDVAGALATLIIARQAERLATRSRASARPEAADEEFGDLSW